MSSNDDELDVCAVCEDPLCGGACRRNPGELVALMGFFGFVLLVIAALARFVL